MRGRERICVALDVPTPEQAVALVEALNKHVGWFKVGKELFAAPGSGPSIFGRLYDAGARNIFCDWKDIDIPNTIKGVAGSHTANGVQMFNVMCAGGAEMMAAAVEGAQARASELNKPRPLIIGVTLLTSIDGDKLVNELRVGMPTGEYVAHLAKMAQISGLDGVVASPKEAALIRETCGQGFLVVTPGIRPVGSDAGDQKRLDNPGSAIRNGADILVIGRPITQATDPVSAAMAIADEIISTEAMMILERRMAVITESHLVYTSGKHGDAYVNKDAVYPFKHDTSELCLGLAEHFEDSGAEVVIAPAVGGVSLEDWTAYHLTNLTGREVIGVYADKEGDGFVLKRGYDKLVAGKKCLVVEDVLNTGGSAAAVVELVRATGGEVVGVGVLCNRGGVTLDAVGNPPELYALVNVTMEAWDEEVCPLCERGVPINTDVGKGAEFLAKKGLKKCPDCGAIHGISERCPG